MHPFNLTLTECFSNLAKQIDSYKYWSECKEFLEVKLADVLVSSINSVKHQIPFPSELLEKLDREHAVDHLLITAADASTIRADEKVLISYMHRLTNITFDVEFKGYFEDKDTFEPSKVTISLGESSATANSSEVTNALFQIESTVLDYFVESDELPKANLKKGMERIINGFSSNTIELLTTFFPKHVAFSAISNGLPETFSNTEIHLLKSAMTVNGFINEGKIDWSNCSNDQAILYGDDQKLRSLFDSVALNKNAFTKIVDFERLFELESNDKTPLVQLVSDIYPTSVFKQFIRDIPMPEVNHIRWSDLSLYGEKAKIIQPLKEAQQLRKRANIEVGHSNDDLMLPGRAI